MKVLVFAHKPPPHHGQSYMVHQLVEALGGDRRRAVGDPVPVERPGAFQCYHVDARLSSEVGDIGRFQARKLWLLFRYCLEAIACRIRDGASVFLYIPAPPQQAALIRDWLVMLCCRPFFSRRVYYWQAAGMGEWLQTGARGWERWLTRRLLGKPDLSLVLSEWCRVDAEALDSRRTRVIPNGVPDPCPEFDPAVLEARRARFLTRQKRASDAKTARGPQGETILFRVLFLSLCTREKGLFDAMEAVRRVNRRLEELGSPIRVQLSVAGRFWREEEEEEFARLAREAGDLGPSRAGDAREPMIDYRGFVDGETKRRLFLDSDCFCFPTYYTAESFGIVVIEAMAFGLPVIATRWRSVPELLPADYAGLVEPKSPDQIVDGLLRLLDEPPSDVLRRRFLAHYTLTRCMDNMKAALNELRYSSSNIP